MAVAPTIGLAEDFKALFLEPISGQCYIAIWVIFILLCRQ